MRKKGFVQYELYIDVLFLENFMMDYLILLVAGKVLACTATHGRLLLGAFAGAFGFCLFICLPVPVPVKLTAFYTLVNICMVFIGLNIRDIRSLFKALILVYLVSFLLGGIMTWLRQYLGGYFKIGSLFFTLTICSYFLLTKGICFFENIFKLRDLKCQVTLCLAGTTLNVPAIIDSGNMLCDPLTGKPVHILCKEAAKKLACTEKPIQIRYIPYSTIHQSSAVLPIVRIDSMLIHQSGTSDKRIDSPLIGISEQPCFDNGTYEMILHPEDD